MMLKKHTLCALTLLCSAPALANIPIESRGLSQNSGSASTPAAIGASNSGAPVTTNLNWQLMQKNVQKCRECGCFHQKKMLIHSLINSVKHYEIEV